MYKKIIFIIMLLSFTMADISALPPKETAMETNSLKILSWNIFMIPYLSSVNKNNFRAKAIADKLNTSDYQIIVFQEAFTSGSRRLLSERLKEAYPYQYGPANKCNIPFLTNSGLWVVSKIPLKELGEIKFAISKGFDKIAQKGAALFEGEYNHKRFQILTTHLQADGKAEMRELQCNQISEQLLNKFYNADVPQLICGDFNIDMYDNHEDYNLMLNTLGAKNGDISGDIQFTYDEINNTLVNKSIGRRKAIDYILVRNDQWIDKIERKVHTFYEKLGQAYSNLSDHYALEATINFN